MQHYQTAQLIEISTAGARSNIDSHYPILSTCTNIKSGTNNGGRSRSVDPLVAGNFTRGIPITRIDKQDIGALNTCGHPASTSLLPEQGKEPMKRFVFLVLAGV